jgi:hypothetical protein
MDVIMNQQIPNVPDNEPAGDASRHLITNAPQSGRKEIMVNTEQLTQRSVPI